MYQALDVFLSWYFKLDKRLKNKIKEQNTENKLLKMT